MKEPDAMLDTVFTFLGEKVLGIFAGHYEFARDTPQQLNDQCYVVYMGRGSVCKRRWRGEKTNKTNKQQSSDKSSVTAPP